MHNPVTAPNDRDNWSGYLSLENAEAVAERLRRLLGGGRRFTTVATNENLDLLHPRVSTGSQLADAGYTGPGEYKDGVYYDSGPRDDGKPRAWVGWADERTSFGIHTSVPTVREAWKVVRTNGAVGHHHMSDPEMEKRGDYDIVYLSFAHDRVEIHQRTGAGGRVVWVLVVEPDPDLGALPRPWIVARIGDGDPVAVALSREAADIEVARKNREQKHQGRDVTYGRFGSRWART